MLKSLLLKLQNLKKYATAKSVIIFLGCAIMVCALFLIKTLATGAPGETTGGSGALASQQLLQARIDGLASKVAGIDQLIAKAKSEPGGTAVADYSSRIDALSSEATNLSNQIDLLEQKLNDVQQTVGAGDVQGLSDSVKQLQSQVAQLQDRLKVAETSLGNTPVTVDGLAIVFITNNVEIGETGPSTPGSGQFAIKIVNTTASTITNVDVTGNIITSQYIFDALASAYPQIVDGAGLCTYTSFIKQDKAIHFEAFGNGKTALSIPAGGSITLRPKISVLAAANEKLPDLALSLSLETISFDRVPAK
jgi:uncharacterized protein YukE